MQALSFDELFAFLSAAPLSSTDLARLREWVGSIRDPAECLALIEAAATGRPCPHCACTHLHRSGFASGLQRYRCLGCRRSFNALTGTPLARLRKRECWLPFIKCLLESRTVRDAALVTGVHRTTSFRWRRRFAPGAARHRPAILSGIVEADETYRLESQKGSRNLTRPPRKMAGTVALRTGSCASRAWPVATWRTIPDGSEYWTRKSCVHRRSGYVLRYVKFSVAASEAELTRTQPCKTAPAGAVAWSFTLPAAQ